MLLTPQVIEPSPIEPSCRDRAFIEPYQSLNMPQARTLMTRTLMRSASNWRLMLRRMKMKKTSRIMKTTRRMLCMTLRWTGMPRHTANQSC